MTEPEYFKGLRAWKRNPLVELLIAAGKGVPRTLVEVAKKRKRDAEAQAKSARDENLLFEEVWCVFDVDEHPKIHEAQQMARDNDISVAMSNPCFELWLLLHCRESPGAQERGALQRMMREHIPGFDKHVDFVKFKAGYQDAAARAARLGRQAFEDGDVGRNPTTDVYLLTNSISE